MIKANLINIWDVLAGGRTIKTKQQPKKPPQLAKLTESSDRLELSQKAKTELRNERIDKTIESGEPLKDVSYEEYCEYFRQKNGYTDYYKMQQEYKQAVKGDKASLKSHEWRTNPAYTIPTRLWGTPEVTADREAALEKMRRGEKLEGWENSILVTFPDATEGCRRKNAAALERSTNIISNKIADKISGLGIELSPDDELTFDVWGYELNVKGDLPEEKLKAIEGAIDDDLRRSLDYIIWGHNHRAELKEEGFPPFWLKEAEHELKGTGVTVFDLSLDKDRNVLGLPVELSAFIEEHAHSEFAFASELDDEFSVQARHMREAFRSAVDTVQSGNYDYFKSLRRELTFKDGKITC